MHRENTIEQLPVIVFSASTEARNYLRGQINDLGYNAVCFGNEAICFDNFRPIQPKFVIAETDSEDVAWRFLFALHVAGVMIPLFIVSEHLNDRKFRSKDYQVPTYFITIDHQKDRPLNKAFGFADAAMRIADKATCRLPLFIGRANAIAKIRAILPIISEARDTVMITGEPGAGKELLARLIVGLSNNEERFIKIDCRQLRPDMLVNGLLERAMGNGKEGKPTTIFLSHLDYLSVDCQAKMLLVLEAAQKIDQNTADNGGKAFRFLAAANRPIGRLVSHREFRKDLFYRLNVIPVAIPALRERKEDISLLMDFFIIEACAKMQKCVTIPSKQSREMCYLHDWPGNVQELKNQMVRVAESGSEFCLYSNASMPKLDRDAREYLFKASGIDELPQSYEIKDHLQAIQNLSLKGICDKFVNRTERRLMKKALESTNWNRKKAAGLLNISYKTMLNKMKTYDII